MSNPVGGGSREPDEPIPPGEYLLALVWFARRTSNANNEYLRCRFVVCSGPMKGNGFFCPWSLNVGKPGCRKRWELWMEACDVDSAIDLDNDRAISEAFKGVPFMAEVKRDQRGQYEGNDLDRMIYKRHWTPANWADIKAWADEWSQKHGWQGQSPDPNADPTGGQEQAPPASEPEWSKGSGFAPGDDEAPPPGDDDIPF